MDTGRLREVLPDTDALVVAAALTDQTRHLLGPAELALLPDGALIVNISRGGMIDTNALVAELRSGRLGGAGLDVTDPEPLHDRHPLWTLPDVVVTPHEADAYDNLGRLFAARLRANLVALHDGEPLLGLVDLVAGY